MLKNTWLIVTVALWLYASIGYAFFTMLHLWFPGLRLQALFVAIVMTTIGAIFNYVTRKQTAQPTLAARLNDRGLAGGSSRPSTPHAQDL